MQPGLQPGFHAGPTPMQIKAQMKADIMHVDFLPDSDISDDRVITKYCEQHLPLLVRPHLPLLVRPLLPKPETVSAQSSRSSTRCR